MKIKLFIFLICSFCLCGIFPCASFAIDDSVDFDAVFNNRKQEVENKMQPIVIEVDSQEAEIKANRLSPPGSFLGAALGAIAKPIFEKGKALEYIMVNATVGVPLCYVEKLTISGGSSVFSNNGSSSVSIMKGYDGALAGNYRFSAKTSCGRNCSGSFRASGTKSNILINLTSGCGASISEH